jgi:proteasome activator subunit 4
VSRVPVALTADVPVGGSIASHNAMSITAADARVSKKIQDAKKPVDRVQSLAETIIYCVAEDAEAKAPSASATPGTATPVNPALSRVQNPLKRNFSGDSLAAASGVERKYMAGSKALDHLSRLLTSCETVSSTLAIADIVLPP